MGILDDFYIVFLEEGFFVWIYNKLVIKFFEIKVNEKMEVFIVINLILYDVGVFRKSVN